MTAAAAALSRHQKGVKFSALHAQAMAVGFKFAALVAASQQIEDQQHRKGDAEEPEQSVTYRALFPTFPAVLDG